MISRPNRLPLSNGNDKTVLKVKKTGLICISVPYHAIVWGTLFYKYTGIPSVGIAKDV